ncbi:hypothetical protein AAFM46_12145 [Arthrobacter sp. TMP15]|uniref:hypothetical protein n=1 Tax=Arthrobacter sp. TMP15 TaxID=3140789 RepID=UPI0031BA9CCA
MRWDLLFGDFETQMHAATAQEMERHINELARVEASQLTLAEALRGGIGVQLTVLMCNGITVHGVVRRVEPQWTLLTEGNRSVLVPLAKILRVQGVGAQRGKASSKVPFTLAAALRILARNRSSVVLDVDSTRPVNLRGVLDQVGADYVQLMQLTDGVSRERGNNQGSVVVPLAALVTVTSSTEDQF